MRTIEQQAALIEEACIRRWSRQAWNLFTRVEKERHLGYEFMCLLAAQEPDSNERLNHYRATARAILEES